MQQKDKFLSIPNKKTISHSCSTKCLPKQNCTFWIKPTVWLFSRFENWPLLKQMKRFSSFSADHKIHCQENYVINTRFGSYWVRNHVETKKKQTKKKKKKKNNNNLFPSNFSRLWLAQISLIWDQLCCLERGAWFMEHPVLVVNIRR